MNTPKNDLDNTLTPGEKASASTPAGKQQGKPQSSASDAMVAAMVLSMNAMATDENRRKKIGMMLV